MTNREEHWHLSKGINLSHMITTAAMVVGGVLYVSDIDKASETNAVEINAIKLQMERQRDDTKEMFKELRGDMKGIDRKLDKLIERELSGK